jgi:serine/threonine-protein kinase
MTEHAKPETVKVDAERVAQALIGKGLVTAEEVEQCRAGVEGGGETLLKGLVAAGYLTPHQARRSAREMPLLLEQQIPGYQLLEKLGRGTTGIVFKARQLSMNRLVAIKVLHQRLATNPEYLQRLTREAHTAAKLSHNSLIQAIDVGSAGKMHYFVMEYVEGTTLRQALDAGRRFGEKEAVDIILQVAQALQHAHRRGLIHRDIKPANVVLTADGVAKLADMGMARDTSDQALAESERGLTIGTPYYMAPEQVRGRADLDVRADIYSLGATFYHLVTGQPPFPGAKVEEVLEAHLTKELTPPDHLNQELSSGLGEVVEFMMAKDRRRRYQKPEDLLIDLECLLNGEAPKLARQKIQAATLEGLAEGETEEEEKRAKPPPSTGKPELWLAILGTLLGLSVALNLLLLILRH